MNSAISHILCIELRRYCPPGVKQIINYGGSCWIGETDGKTVLKYPHTDEGMKWV